MSGKKRANIATSKLAAGETDKIFFDDELTGFGLRVRAGGSRKWVYHYRQAGIQRRATIGNADAMTLDEARKRARKIRVALDDGKDPAAEKATKRAEAELTFVAVAEKYLVGAERKLKPRSYGDVQRHLLQHWKPLHKLPVASVNRAVIAAHLHKIAEERGPVAADRARANLSAMFTWSIGEGLCDANPVTGTNKVQEEKPRDLVLTDAELAAIWKALPDGDYGRIVKLLMLTAQRRDEIGSLRWSEVNTEKKQIELPKERTKNSRPHEVPLSDMALELLVNWPRQAKRDLVFGEGQGGYAGWSRAKTNLDKAVKIKKDWRIHDLRRTVATRMADLGVQPHVLEALLNHVSGHKAGVAGIYNRSVYANEKRAALDLWAGHLRLVLAQADGANVVKIAKARA